MKTCNMTPKEIYEYYMENLSDKNGLIENDVYFTWDEFKEKCKPEILFDGYIKNVVNNVNEALNLGFTLDQSIKATMLSFLKLVLSFTILKN